MDSMDSMDSLRDNLPDSLCFTRYLHPKRLKNHLQMKWHEPHGMTGGPSTVVLVGRSNGLSDEEEGRSVIGRKSGG